MSELSDYLDFLLKPAIETGYTWDKTLFYGIILIIAVFLIFKLLRKLKVKIDRDLGLAVFPFIIFGGTLRVARDLGLLNYSLFATPYIYFFVFFIFLAILLVSLLIEKKYGTKYSKIMFLSGFILAVMVIVSINYVNLYGGLIVLLIFSPFALFFTFFKRWSLQNRLVTSIQTFDSIVTFTSINFFGYGEQHVAPTLLMNIFGPFSFVILKIIAVVSALIIIDKFSDDKELNNYVKLVIAILALGTSSRDFSCLLSSCIPS